MKERYDERWMNEREGREYWNSESLMASGKMEDGGVDGCLANEGRGGYPDKGGERDRSQTVRQMVEETRMR